MKHTLIAVAAAAALLSLSACKTAEEGLRETGAVQITGAQLEERYAGDSQWAWTTATHTGTTTYNADGSGVVDWGTGNSKGTWRIKGDQICTSWEFRGGKERCNRVYRLAPGKYRLIDVDSGDASTAQKL